MKKSIYFENLDAIRSFCFLMVFLFHSFYTENMELKQDYWYKLFALKLFENGNLGVNFFFVLSGFLITYLLLIERQEFNKIHIINFWIRRILRIWPLYFFCVGFGFFIFPIIKNTFGQSSVETAHLLNYITFTNNFDLIKNGLPDASVLGVLWSIAIEEQFYLIWPILLSLFPTKRYWIIFSLIIIVSLIFRAYHLDYMNMEYHTLSCISDMSVGAFGAWLFFKNRSFKKFILKLPRLFIISIYATFFLLFFFRKEVFYQSQNYILIIFERLFCSLPMILIILEQSFCKNSIFKLQKLKLITKLGKYTYGMYCLHFIAILIILKSFVFLGINDSLLKVLILDPSLSLILTVIISIFSYRYFESFFLKLKNKFALIKTKPRE